MSDARPEDRRNEPRLDPIAADPHGAWSLVRGAWRGVEPRIVQVAQGADADAREAPEDGLRFDHPGLGRVVARDRLAGRDALVLEDPGGESLAALRGSPRPASWLLPLAVDMASALAALHAAGHVHGRLVAESYVLDANGTRAVLVDLLPIARPASDAAAHARAPEQAHGPADARTDLYLLGAVLYELCVGSPADDGAARVARTVPPHERDARVPEGLSDLVMALLAVDPRDRYADAVDLLRDLAHARRLLDEHGRIPRFVLSLRDSVRARPAPVLPVGRAAERSVLDDALARVAAGERRRVDLVGPAGIGKTTLVETLRGPTLARGGCFGFGRVDVLCAPRPLGALAGALDEIAAQLLAGDAARLARVRGAVARAVGPNGALVASLGHRLAALVPPAAIPGGGATPAHEGVTAASARLLDAVERFVVAVAEAAPPLVLALDDLHRADTETLTVLRTLAGARDARHLLVVGAWRTEEDRALPDGLPATRLDLCGLDAPAVAELVDTTLGDLGADTAPLVQLVHRRTRGNPLFVRAYLHHLLAAGAIHGLGVRGGAAVDLDLAATMDPNAGVAAILVQRLRGLPEPVRDALAVGARIGDPFAAALVAAELAQPLASVEARLAEAAAAGIVAPVPDDPERSWRFLHDRLHQAAIGLREGGAATALHARLGRLLCDALGPNPDATRLLRAVHQRGLGAAALGTVAERDELAGLNLRAAGVARVGGGFGAALSLADAGLAHLGDDPWRRADLAEPLLLEGARAAVLADPERVDPLIDALLARTTDPVRAAEALEIRVDHELARSNAEAALAATREALKRLGYRLPERVGKSQVAVALVRAGVALQGRSTEAILALPEVTDARAAAVLRLLLRASTAAYVTDPELFAYMACEMVRLGLDAGASPGTAWGLLVFAILRSSALGDLEGGYELGEQARRMLDRFAPHGLEAKAASVWFATMHHIHHPLAASVPALEAAVRQGYAEGDPLHAGINATFYVNHVVLGGEPLDRVRASIEAIEADLGRRRQDLALDTSAPFRALARRLLEGSDPLGEDPAPDPERPFQAFSVYFCRCLLAVLSGRDAEALASARGADPFLAAARGTVNEPLFLFYGAVAAGRELAFGGTRDSGAGKRLRVGLAAMRRRAQANAADYASRVALLEALDRVVRGRPLEAFADLDVAVRSARGRGAPHEAALALETAARLHDQLGAGETGRLLASAALDAWRAWGAVGLASSAAARLGLPNASSGPDGADRGPDAEVVFRATEALAGEVGREALLGSLVRLAAMQAGAERVVLFSAGGDRLRVRAVCEADVVSFLPGVPLGAYGRACAAAVHRAARTGEVVLEADAARVFGDDAWVRSAAVRAVLAVPVFLRGALTGVLLLESTRGSFAPADVAPLRALASVAAALVENAELLALVEVRAGELRNANAALVAHSRLLEERVHARTAELDALTRLQSSILDTLSEGVCGIGPDGRVTFANPAAAALLDVRVADLVGAPFHDAFHARDASDGPAGGDVAPADACPLCASTVPLQDVPARLRRPDGSVRWVECAVRPSSGAAPVRVISFRDVWRRRELESQVRHDQKMEAIALFVGGVAHEFNNLLTPILGGVELTRESLGSDHPLQRPLAGLERAGDRAAELVRQLLALGRREEVERPPIDLAALGQEVITCLRRTFGPVVTLTYTPTPGAWARIEDAQFRQVLVNLCVNARDALLAAPEGPARIDVAVRPLVIEPAATERDPAARPGAWIEVTVADTGPGMPPEVLSRAFEPFFTTKEVGAGTGLGLSVLYGIVQQYGGWVSATSAPGEGTTFRCLFPATTPDAPAVQVDPEPPSSAGLRILVVDDEQMVRSVTRSALEHFGYAVEEAADGIAALAALQSGNRPDAILLDLMMPGLDGWGTLARIRAFDPTIPVVLMSGYDQRASEHHPATPDAHLTKPYHLRDLARTLGDVIGRRPEG